MEAEGWNRSKYISLAATYYFVPIAVETLGALGEEAAVFISDLGRRIVATIDSLPFSVSQHCHPARQRCFCHRNFSPSAKWEDIYYL